MLDLLRKSAIRRQEGRRLYDGLVTRARAGLFFRDFAVPDTVDGRFDMVALHAWLVLSVLGKGGHGETAQGLTDVIFTGFDEALREQGAGDMGISRKLKAFADGFYGRMAAYEAARNADEMAAALARNLYRGRPVDACARALAVYVLAARARLEEGLPETLDFGPLPVPPMGDPS
ncbi:MAG TPA: ubiquinol-cytochrome C chaperone family protein [Rhizomicrobium sp.]|nr:ubiquinol-cytochrome C chaperone family protein [Rhizomicrobium sp.]